MKLSTNFAMIALASALLAPIVVGASALPATAVAPVEAAEPPCVRKVKVVYAGYGSTGCAQAERTR